MFNWKSDVFHAQLRQWLHEDIGSGDVTTLTTIPENSRNKGIIHMKSEGILCGVTVAEQVFAVIDPQLAFQACKAEGQWVAKGTIVAEVYGSTQSILLGERLALNLMQRLSGIATRTRQFVDQLEGMSTRMVDTRKTTPGHRMLEKYAVRVGGGHNHRFGLYDAVMIKDNHIKGAGGIRAAVLAARANIPHTMKIEVEVETFDQLDEAIAVGADIILLDNMSIEQMRQASARIKSQSPHIIAEASGNVSLQTVREIAETGVDVISAGRLTYSIEALDISLDLIEQKGAQQ